MSIMRNAIADHQRAKLIRKVDREIDNPTPKNVQKLKEQMGAADVDAKEFVTQTGSSRQEQAAWDSADAHAVKVLDEFDKEYPAGYSDHCPVHRFFDLTRGTAGMLETFASAGRFNAEAKSAREENGRWGAVHSLLQSPFLPGTDGVARPHARFWYAHSNGDDLQARFQLSSPDGPPYEMNLVYPFDGSTRRYGDYLEDGHLEAGRLYVRDERWQAGGSAKDVVRPLSPDEAKAILPQIQRAMDQGHGEVNPDCGVDVNACGQLRDALTAYAGDESSIRISESQKTAVLLASPVVAGATLGAMLGGPIGIVAGAMGGLVVLGLTTAVTSE